MKTPAPVAVYTYTRLKHLQQTLDALALNELASETTVYVVSDGPKNERDRPLVEQLRNFVDDFHGFHEIVRVYREANLGVGVSPLLAEHQIISDHGKIINLEDDNITSGDFLTFINEGLSHFESDRNIFSICGYAPPVCDGLDRTSDWWIYPWNLSWGYGTWKDRYDKIYPLANDYMMFKKSGLLDKVAGLGGLYIVDSLRRDHHGQAKFLDAVLCAKMTQFQMSSVIPTKSKVNNIGLDGSGVSTRRATEKYSVALDSTPKRHFDFGRQSTINVKLRADALRFYNGKLATRLARRFGLYHKLSALRPMHIS
jgi:hypothetical protein